MTECKYNKCERCGYANECKIKAVLFTTEGRLSLAKALLTQWLHGGSSNINIVSDTQRFLEVEHDRATGIL